MTDSDRQNSPLYVEKEVHLLDYVHVVQRRWRIAVILFLLVFSGVAVKTFLQTPIYQAGVVMRIGYKAEASQELLQLRKESRFSIDSEIQVLRSYALAEQAAKKLSLDWRLDKPDKGLDLHLRTVDAPENYQALVIELTGPESYLLRTTDGQELLRGVSDQVTGTDEVRARIVIHHGRAGDRARLVRLSQGEAVGRVLAGASASEMGDGSNLLQLTVQNADPMLAADIANALAEAYYEQSRESKAAEATLMLGFIAQQLGALGQDLDRSEQALQEFKIRTGLERLSPEGVSMVDTAVGLEKQRAELTLNLKRLDRFIAGNNWSTAELAVVEKVPGAGEYVKQLLELRTLRNDLLRSYTTAHPAVVEVDDQVRQVQGKILGAARLAHKRMEQQLTDLNLALRESSARLEQVPEEELELVRLTRANQVNAELYSYLLQRQQESRILQASTSSNVEIIDRAQVPGAPVKPNKKKNLALGLILGLMLGVGLTFLLDYLDRTVKDEDDVQEKLGLSVLGTIPRIPLDELGRSRQLISQLEPLSAPSEAFLALRTNLLYIVTNQKHRTVMFTSCLPGEGKSTVAANLALTLSQTGARTLLLGCDLRRPSLYKMFFETEAPGLTDLLATGNRRALRRIRGTNLHFIPAGTEPPNPTQLLNSELMRQLLARARHRYDYVIIDAPPLLPVADALILASQVDINVMVLESCRIPEKLAKRAIKALHNHGAQIAGVVLNDKTGKGAKYYGEYSYYEGKYYRGYYRRDEPEPVLPLWRRILQRVWGFING